jgi:hypothetical protein
MEPFVNLILCLKLSLVSRELLNVLNPVYCRERRGGEEMGGTNEILFSIPVCTFQKKNYYN